MCPPAPQWGAEEKKKAPENAPRGSAHAPTGKDSAPYLDTIATTKGTIDRENHAFSDFLFDVHTQLTIRDLKKSPPYGRLKV
jgi:hypothetical protein